MLGVAAESGRSTTVARRSSVIVDARIAQQEEAFNGDARHTQDTSEADDWQALSAIGLEPAVGLLVRSRRADPQDSRSFTHLQSQRQAVQPVRSSLVLCHGILDYSDVSFPSMRVYFDDECE